MPLEEDGAPYVKDVPSLDERVGIYYKSLLGPLTEQELGIRRAATDAMFKAAGDKEPLVRSAALQGCLYILLHDDRVPLSRFPGTKAAELSNEERRTRARAYGTLLEATNDRETDVRLQAFSCIEQYIFRFIASAPVNFDGHFKKAGDLQFAMRIIKLFSKSLSDPDREVRSWSFDRLTVYTNWTDVVSPLFLDALLSKHPDVRRQVFSKMKQSNQNFRHPLSPQMMSAMVAAIGDAERSVAEEAQEFLLFRIRSSEWINTEYTPPFREVRIKENWETVIPSLLELSKGSDPTVRVRAISVLSVIDTNSDATVSSLVASLKVAEPEAFCAAANALDVYGRAAVLASKPELLHSAVDRLSEVVQRPNTSDELFSAVKLLLVLQPPARPQIIDSLIDGLKHHIRGSITAEAIMLLRNVGLVEPSEIMGLLKDGDEVVRHLAAYSLGQELPTLVPMASPPAAPSLDAVPPAPSAPGPAPPAPSQPHSGEAGGNRMIGRGNQEVMPSFAADSPISLLASRKVKFASHTSSPGTINDLRSALRDNNPWVRVYVSRIIAGMGEQGRTMIPDLLTAFRTGEVEDIIPRLALAESVLWIDSRNEEAIRFVIRGLDSPDEMSRLAVMEILQNPKLRFYSSPSWLGMTSKLNDKDPLVRIRIWNFLSSTPYLWTDLTPWSRFLLRDSNPVMRRSALKFVREHSGQVDRLGEYEARSRLNELVPLLADPDVTNRTIAASLFGYYRDRASPFIPVLVTVLNRSFEAREEKFRNALVGSLVIIDKDGPTTLSLLRTPRFGATAAGWLDIRTQRIIPPLALDYLGVDASRRRQAALVMVQLIEKGASAPQIDLEKLLRDVLDPDPIIRRFAILLLKQYLLWRRPLPFPFAPAKVAPAPMAPSMVRPGEIYFFPWPPPRYSTSRAFATSTFGDKQSRMEDLRESIDKALDGVGYSEKRLLPIEGYKGFVYVTRIERIHADGSSFDELQRFTRVKLRCRTSWEWAQSLFSAPESRYRLFVVAVTSLRISGGESELSSQLADYWMTVPSIGRTLPMPLADEPIGNHDAYILVYEFEKLQGKKNPMLVKGENEALPANVHLDRSRIGSSLSAIRLKTVPGR